MTALDDALARATHFGVDPASLTRHANAELELDATSGGLAFIDDKDRVVLVGYDGSFGVHMLYDATPTPDAVIERWLLERRHAHRRLVADELGVWQRAAMVAVDEGVSVAELDLGLGDADTDYVEYLALMLRRSPLPPLRALAADDHLLAEPEDRRYTHPCPLCSLPAIHADRYPRAVCDSCHGRTVDSAGRRVTGANVSLSGGFVAHFTETGEIAAEVTATKRCWVDGQPCRIDEAHLGGVVVEAL